MTMMLDSTIELPDSVKAALAQMDGGEPAGPQLDDATMQTIKDIAKAVVARRDKYVRHRAASGIEGIWQKCEDNYAGIDEQTGPTDGVYRSRWTKGATVDSSLRGERTPKSNGKSRAYERLTTRYVNAAEAKIIQMSIAGNKELFAIEPTPVPDLIKMKEDLTQIVQNGIPLERDPKPEELAPPNPADPLIAPPVDPANPPSGMPGVPVTPKDLADEAMQEAVKKAKEAEKIIADWLVEAKFVKQLRKMFQYASKLGVGIIYGPFPEMRKTKVVTNLEDGTMALEIKSEMKPGIMVIPPWDFFPDGECGDDIQSGDGCFHRDHISEHALEKLKDMKGYFGDEIEQVIEEGPKKSNIGGQRDEVKRKDDRYERWHFTGWLTREEIKAVNAYMRLDSEQDKHTHLIPEKDEVSVSITLVNDSVIRCAINALETSGEYPYHVLRWTPREGSWDGVGVSEQLFLAQEMIVAGTRALLNNAGVSSGSQIVVLDELIQAADLNDQFIYADKLWKAKVGAAIDDIRKAFAIFNIPNFTEQLLLIIEHAYKVAENSCNIPLVSQGLSGRTTPETLGQTELQNNNANQLLLNVADEADESIMQSLIQQLYEWIMLSDDPTHDAAKGDYHVVCRGFRSLMERSLKTQFLLQQGQIVKDPAFGANPKNWYKQVLISQHFNPADILYTEEEQQKMASIPPPADPRIEVAKINAEVKTQATQADMDRDRIYEQTENQKVQIAHEATMAELQLKREIANLTYQTKLTEFAMKKEISAEQAKKDLATTAMELNVTKQLSLHDAAVDGRRDRQPPPSTPVIEPDGKAKPGRSFQA